MRCNLARCYPCFQIRKRLHFFFLHLSLQFLRILLLEFLFPPLEFLSCAKQLFWNGLGVGDDLDVTLAL